MLVSATEGEGKNRNSSIGSLVFVNLKLFKMYLELFKTNYCDTWQITVKQCSKKVAATVKI